MRTAEEIEREMRRSKGMTWAHFESNNRGEIPLRLKGFRETILIRMRVGLHMGKPMQALIADDQFIRMRSVPEYESYSLNKLEPEWPDKCLYKPSGLGYLTSGKNLKIWKPVKQGAGMMGEIISTTMRNRTGQLSQNLARSNAMLLRMTKK